MGWTCCVCDRMVQMGPHVWEGRFVPQWGKLAICRTCERLSRDGIVVRTFPDLRRRIEAAGGRVTENAQGHIVVPPLGSN